MKRNFWKHYCLRIFVLCLFLINVFPFTPDTIADYQTEKVKVGQITETTEWTDSDGKKHTRVVTTYIYEDRERHHSHWYSDPAKIAALIAAGVAVAGLLGGG